LSQEEHSALELETSRWILCRETKAVYRQS